MAVPQKIRCSLLAAFLGGLGILPALSQDIVAAGKQRAESSRVEWEIRDARHPALGDIRYAYMKNLHVTPVGISKVYSRAYVSCAKSTRKIGIELTNTQAPDDPGGLKPAARPRLLCGRPAAAGGAKLVQDEVIAPFDVDSKTGDALARGLSSSDLRQCVAIIAIQEVALPPGWSRKSARVEFEFLPYSKDLDAIFATCGERTAYAPPPVAPAATVAAALPSATTPPAASKAVAPAPAAAAQTQPAPAQPVPTQPAPAQPAPPPAAKAAPAVATVPQPPVGSEWITARVIFGGRTNVRAAPNTNATIVTRVDPGDFVLIQKTGNEWWRAKNARGTAWEGFIREDRLAIK